MFLLPDWKELRKWTIISYNYNESLHIYHMRTILISYIHDPKYNFHSNIICLSFDSKFYVSLVCNLNEHKRLDRSHDSIQFYLELNSLTHYIKKFSFIAVDSNRFGLLIRRRNDRKLKTTKSVWQLKKEWRELIRDGGEMNLLDSL